MTVHIIMDGSAEIVALTTGSAVSAQLPKGRYLVRVAGLGANTAWLLQGASGVTATAGTAGETPFLDASGDALIEVREGTTDGYIAGIMTVGTATLVITPVRQGRVG